jgi:hypothetical protein
VSSGSINADVLENKLNDMAKEGWELDQIDQGERHYIFRRPHRPLPEQLILEQIFDAERLRVDPSGIGDI